MHTAQDARADPKEYDFVTREIVFVEDGHKSVLESWNLRISPCSKPFIDFRTVCDGRRKLSYMDLRHPPDISGNSRMSVGVVVDPASQKK